MRHLLLALIVSAAALPLLSSCSATVSDQPYGYYTAPTYYPAYGYYSYYDPYPRYHEGGWYRNSRYYGHPRVEVRVEHHEAEEHAEHGHGYANER